MNQMDLFNPHSQDTAETPPGAPRNENSTLPSPYPYLRENVAPRASQSLTSDARLRVFLTDEGFRADQVEGFIAYHSNNPHLFDEFCRRCEEFIRVGHKQFSAMTIIGAMRHDSALKSVDGMYKINNNTATLYSRLFMHLYGYKSEVHSNFFGKRKVGGNGE